MREALCAFAGLIGGMNMKRFWMIALVLLLSLSLFGCAAKQTNYTVTMRGIQFTVDTVQKTITEGENVYHYTASGGSSFGVTITYPNGSTYSFSQSGGMGMSSWSDDYAEDVYTPGDILVDVLKADAPKRLNPDKVLAGLILVAVGIFDVLAPKVSWYLGYGWRYKDAEPSDAALVFARIGGAIVIAIGIALLFFI